MRDYVRPGGLELSEPETSGEHWLAMVCLIVAHGRLCVVVVRRLDSSD